MLILFVDALPHYIAKDLKFTERCLKNVNSLTPGYGYSVNLHSELFAGKAPDEVGFFGEWKFKGFTKPTFFFRVAAAIEDYFPSCTRILKLFLNKFLRAGICYIPFRFLPLFEKAGVYPLVRKNVVDSVIDQYEFCECIADRVSAGLGKKDVVVYSKAIKAIESNEKNIFVSMCDLDGMFHEFGVDSNEIQNKISSLDEDIINIVDKYQEKFPAEPIILLSDHGICDVHTKVELDLNRYSDLIKSGELVYFYDSLYLQVWLKSGDESLLDEITEYLIQNFNLEVITSEMRVNNGLTDGTFGDRIFVLKEGYGFTPNFFGFRCLKSYHGYNPIYTKSKGVVASNISLDGVERNVDVYKWIVNKLTANN